eukprot:1185172-Prorocentrum_minimum.AAC.5
MGWRTWRRSSLRRGAARRVEGSKGLGGNPWRARSSLFRWCHTCAAARSEAISWLAKSVTTLRSSSRSTRFSAAPPCSPSDTMRCLRHAPPRPRTPMRPHGG